MHPAKQLPELLKRILTFGRSGHLNPIGRYGTIPDCHGSHWCYAKLRTLPIVLSPVYVLPSWLPTNNFRLPAARRGSVALD